MERNKAADILLTKLDRYVVIRSDNYEIEYANPALEAELGGPLAGKPCYNALFGHDAPCGYCPMKSVKSGEVYNWECYNSSETHHMTSVRFKNGEQEYFLSRLTNVTDFTMLSNSALKYIKFLDRISTLQAVLLDETSDFPKIALPMMAEFCEAETILFFSRDAAESTVYLYRSSSGQTHSLEWVFRDADADFLRHSCNVGHDELTAESRTMLSRITGMESIENLCTFPLETDEGLHSLVFLNVNIKPESNDIKPLMNIFKTYILNNILNKRLVWCSTHDALTSLLNKNEFYENLAGYYSQLQTAAVLFIDMDNLKEVNDACGHQTGDELIRRIAAAILADPAQKNHSYRMGGDEFVVVYPDCPNHEAALALKARIENDIQHLNNTPPDAKISFGIAFSDANPDVAELMHCADAAMYEEKMKRKAGRSR